MTCDAPVIAESTRRLVSLIMPVHAFIDEARRAKYVPCAAAVATSDLAAARRRDACSQTGNRRRLHMHSESAASRRKILAEFVRRCPIDSAHVGIARIDGQAERDVRDARFRCLVPDIVGLNAERLVVESCSQDAQDSRVIAAAIAAEQAIGRLRFDVVPAAAEEMLWAADLIA